MVENHCLASCQRDKQAETGETDGGTKATGPSSAFASLSTFGAAGDSGGGPGPKVIRVRQDSDPDTCNVKVSF